MARSKYSADNAPTPYVDRALDNVVETISAGLSEEEDIARAALIRMGAFALPYWQQYAIKGHANRGGKITSHTAKATLDRLMAEEAKKRT